MKHMTLKEVNQLKKAIAARTDRVQAINRRMVFLSENGTKMTSKELSVALEEVDDLRKELREHKKFIDDAQSKINAFYAPAIR